MSEKRDYRVIGKCTAVTYAEHCRCTRGVVFGLHECVFFDCGMCNPYGKNDADSSQETIEDYDSRVGDDGYSDGSFEDCD